MIDRHHFRRLAQLVLAVFAMLATTGPLAWAEVKLSPPFGDHMVLQRETKAPIWGQASPGEKITVRFRDQELKTEAGADGRWQVALTGLKAGGPDELTIQGNNTVTLKDVLVGEVWVGSGQSNMAGLARSYAQNDPVLAKLIDNAYPQIRGYSSKEASWQAATPESNRAFSALLFSFAVRMHDELHVPVGMMLGAVGGTPSGAWLSEAALKDDAKCQELIAEYAKSYDAELKEYNERILPTWEKSAAKAKAAGKPVGRTPAAPPKPGVVRGQSPGYLYEANIRPFVGYGIRGVLWDQGEASTAVGGVDQYTLMGALIRGWRKEWNAGEFPFIYVQKPSGGGCAWDQHNPVNSQAEQFQAQPTEAPGPLIHTGTQSGHWVENHVRIMNYPHVGMAISSDLGPMVHPTNKSGYGSRAATVALAMAYGKPVEYYGPIYASHTIEGDKVRVKFTHVGQGLAARHADKLQGFVIAGHDKQFHWADGRIDGDTVVVSSPEVSKPASVRYAWAYKRPWANLFNKDGLPAVTFRTDAW